MADVPVIRLDMPIVRKVQGWETMHPSEDKVMGSHDS